MEDDKHNPYRSPQLIEPSDPRHWRGWVVLSEIFFWAMMFLFSPVVLLCVSAAWWVGWADETHLCIAVLNFCAWFALFICIAPVALKCFGY